MEINEQENIKMLHEQMQKINEVSRKIQEDFAKQFPRETHIGEYLIDSEKYPKNAIWNCKFCNKRFGCNECNPEKLCCDLVLTSPLYYVEKIRCKCIEINFEGCKNCKFKTFIVLRYYAKPSHSCCFHVSQKQINDCKNDIEKFKEFDNIHTVIIEETFDQIDQILNCDFIIDSEKIKIKNERERRRELMRRI